MVQRTAPLLTLAPTSAARPETVPALCAVIGCSIFIASSTTTRSPASTVAPSSTATFTIVPCMGEVRSSPEGALLGRGEGAPGARRAASAASALARLGGRAGGRSAGGEAGREGDL